MTSRARRSLAPSPLPPRTGRGPRAPPAPASPPHAHALPGLRGEMVAVFERLGERSGGEPIGAWRRRYKTGEGQIVTVLEEATRRHPDVTVGSYPSFFDTGPQVEVVLKSA